MSPARAEARAPGLFIGRPLGIPVFLSPSVLLLAVLVTVQIADHPDLAARSGTARAAVGLVAAVLLALSILLHELGHSAVALAMGIPIRRITLFLFGGIAEITREPDTAAKEYLVSIAGPLVSLTLGGLGLVALELTSGPEAAVLFGYAAFINVALGVFNLLPGLPLDGGRVLRAAVWQARGDRLVATRVAARSGMVLGVLLGGAGLIAIVTGDGLSIFTLLIAYFIYSGARASLAQSGVARLVPSLDVRSLTRPVLPVTADLPLAEALRRAAVDERRLLVVDAEGTPSAVISSAAVAAVPTDRRPWVSVGSVSRRLVTGLVLDSRLEGEAVLSALRSTPASEYLVVDDEGGVVGVLAARDVARRLAPQS
ncbi:MAG TPA: site-2 protease family protein [Mycobacteriales bacterium]|nr:site-2 protease family protein [Mycobacteriales bacterium]